MSINEVMLDRWLLEQIEEEYEVAEIDENAFVPREELSPEVLELINWLELNDDWPLPKLSTPPVTGTTSTLY